MSSIEAINADVRFVAETGTASREIEALRQKILSAYSSVDEQTLRAAAAQDKFDRALGRAGSNAQRQRAAVLSYRRELESINTSAARASTGVNKLERDVDRLGRGAIVGTGLLRGLGRAAAFASAGFVGGAGLVYAFRRILAEQATVQEETEKTSVVFGKQARQVQAWAKTLSASFGVSEAAALKAAGTFGNMLRPLGFGESAAAAMSKRLVELAADMASFNNVSPATVLQALASGLAGQVRPLRQYGVFLSQARIQEEAYADAIAKRGAKLSQAQKVEAAYNIILKDTKLQQGDVARNTESLSVAWSKLTAALSDTEGGSSRLRDEVTKLVNRAATWLGDTQHQKQIQDELNHAVQTGAKVVHGLADAEKLIAPPIQGAVKALGGLDKAVEAALIIGLVAKTRKAAGGLGLIQSASARARTQIVADAVVEERALAGVAAQATRTSGVVSRVGAYTGAGAVGGVAAGAGTAGLIRKYGAKVGGPLALAALLYGSTETGGGIGGNLSSAATYGFLGYAAAGPLGAALGVGGYEVAQGGQALSNYLGGLGIPGLGNQTPTLQQLAQAAAAGQISLADLDKLAKFGVPANVISALRQIVTAATVYTVTQPPATKQPIVHVPATASGATPGYLTPAQQRKQALLLHPDDLAALRAEVTYDDRALAFLEKERRAGKVTGQEYLQKLQAITSDRDQNQSKIDQILQAQASKTAAAARKRQAAAKKAEAERIKEVNADAQVALSGVGPLGVDVAKLQKAHDAYLRSVGVIAKDALKGVTVGVNIPDLQATYAQQLQNRLSLAQLHETQAGGKADATKKAIREELAAWNAILDQQQAEAEDLTGLAKAQKQGEIIASRQAIVELQQQLKQKTSLTSDARANEAQFLSAFADIQNRFGGNTVQLGGATDSHLYDIKHENRRQTKGIEKLGHVIAASASTYGLASSFSLFG